MSLATPPARRPPGEPGPGPLPDAVLRSLEITIRRRIEGLLPGEHRASRPGPGTELQQVRPYEPGDDVRLIDWNVTARTGEPHVRVHVAERALVTWLVVDASPSMRFGTAERRKADVAEGVALAVAHVATRRGNRLGVVTFGHGRRDVRPPRQGRAGLLGLLAELRRAPAADGVGRTELGEALSRTARMARQRALVVVVSDFRGPRDFRRPLLELGERHDLLAVEVRDRREQELTDLGVVWMTDPETGRQLCVDTGSRRLRERFARAAAAEREALGAFLLAAGCDHVVLWTQGDWLRPLAASLRLRGGSR